MMSSAPEFSMTPQQREFTEGVASGDRGALARYRHLVVGSSGTWGQLFAVEFAQFCLGGLYGLAGLGLRGFFYPWLLRSCGARVAFGRSVTLRQPQNISLGKSVIIDDFVGLEVRGDGGEIRIGDSVVVGRLSTVVAKSALISFASGVNIGSYCRIATQSSLSIGESTLIAAFCYLGPGNHQTGGEAGPLIEQPMEIKGGVHIGKHVWIGAHSTILDGVTIGDGAIVGAHSLVRDNVPAGAVVAGVPARVIR